MRLASNYGLNCLVTSRKELADGGTTFKGKGARKSLDYVLVKNDLTGNAACQILYREYEMHLRSPMFLDVKMA